MSEKTNEATKTIRQFCVELAEIDKAPYMTVWNRVNMWRYRGKFPAFKEPITGLWVTNENPEDWKGRGRGKNYGSKIK
jgi:hypothetical protein